MPSPPSGADAPLLHTRERLYEEIVDRLQAKMLSGELRPGDRIPAERALAKQYGVSRSAVREAIKSLKEKGLIDVAIGRGIFVIAVSTDHVVGSMTLLLRHAREKRENLHQARELLEIPIARLAAINRSPEHVARLRTILERMESSGNVSHPFIDADSEFHLELARATRNAVLEVLVQTMLAMMRSERIFMVGFKDEIPGALASHRRILKAIEQQDGDRAAQAMTDHLGHVAAVLRAIRGAASKE